MFTVKTSTGATEGIVKVVGRQKQYEVGQTVTMAEVFNLASKGCSVTIIYENTFK